MQLEKIKTLLNRKFFVSVLILLLVALSSFRVLDDYTDRYTTESIQNAAISYATARGINALVSMMQTTTIQAGVGISGSISVGELLDPLNDLIERFSSVMTFVLASLAGQKVLLLISSHHVFQILVIFFGVLSILTLLMNKTSSFIIIFKSFLLLVFIRFSLGIAVALNAMVDSSFLMDQTNIYDNEIKILRQDMSSFNNEPEVTPEEIQKYREELKMLMKEHDRLTEFLQKKYPNEKNRLNSTIKVIKENLKKEKNKLSRIERVFTSNSEIESLERKLEIVETELASLKDVRNDGKKAIKDISKKITILENRISGEPDGFFDNLKKKSTAILNSIDIDEIEQKVNRSISNFMNLIAIYVLKTIPEFNS